MKCSLDISNFLEKNSSLSHYIVFSISLHWLLRKAFLPLLAIFWNSAFKWIYFSFSLLLFTSLLDIYILVQFSSVTQSCLTLCNPMNHSTPSLPVHHQLQEVTQIHVHRVGDAIQPSHPLSSPSPPAPNPSQHQGLFQWINSSHEVAKVFEFQL